MKKLLIILLILSLSLSVQALEIVRQKNVATYIFFPLIDDNGDNKSAAGGLDSEMDTFADGTAPDGFADCTNEATEIGTDGWYYLSLTQAEMNFDYIAIQVKSTGANTQNILIRTTVGDPANLATSDDGGTINVTGGAVDTVTTLTGHTAQTGDSFARIGAPAGASVSADVAAIKAETASILTDTAEIGAAGAGLTNIDLPNQTMDIVGNITGNLSGSVGSLTGHTVQTGDSFAIVNGAAGLVAINTDVEAILADTGTDGVVVAAVNADAIEAGDFKTDAIDADALAADFVTEIWAKAMSDLAAGAPSATCSVLTAMNYLYEAWRNKTVTDGTNSEVVIYKDDENTKLVECDINDDGTDFTRGKMGAPD